jgi:hypothetical protein
LVTAVNPLVNVVKKCCVLCSRMWRTISGMHPRIEPLAVGESER